MARYPIAAPGGSALPAGIDSAAPWKLVTTWGSLFDPDSRLSSFTHTAGLLEYVMAGDTVLYDGFRENGPGVETLVQDIEGLENFDPTTWLLLLFDEYVSFPLGSGADLYGAELQLTDDTLANRASADGIGFGLERASSSVFRALSYAETGVGPGGTNNLGDQDAAKYVISFSEAAANAYMRMTSGFRNTGLSTWVDGTTLLGRSISLVGSDIRLAARMMHRNSTSDTPTIQRRVYAAGYDLTDPA